MRRITVALMTALAISVVSVCGSAAGAVGSNESVSDFSYYDQLDENNKAAYDALEQWSNPTDESVVVELPKTLSYQTTSADMSTWDTAQMVEFGKLVMSGVQNGKSAFCLEHPGVFWFDENNIGININYSVRTNFFTGKQTMVVRKIIMTPNVSKACVDLENARECADILTEEIENYEIIGSDFYSKLRYIHDKISYDVSYSINALHCSSAYGAFVEPYQIVCEGYVKLVKLLCDREGIPCIIVPGNLNTETNTAHVWNYIQMEDGKWYGFDLTWDDLDDPDNPFKYQYFLTGSDSFFEKHTADASFQLVDMEFEFPELSTGDYVYKADETTPTAVTTTQAETTATTTSITTETETTTTSTSTSATAVSESPSETVTELVTTSGTDTDTNTDETSATTVTEEPDEPTTTEIVRGLMGDFNDDGAVEISDVIILQKMLLGVIPIEEETFSHDMNDDGKINVWDLMILLRIVSSGL